MKLNVFRDNYGSYTLVGTIQTVPGYQEQFTYDSDYLTSNNAAAISRSLPLQEESFPVAQTRPYFEGLLPEEGARQSLARKLGVKSSSYLKILAHVGYECIGDLLITEEDVIPDKLRCNYEPFTESNMENASRSGSLAAPMIQAQTRLSLAGAQMKIGLYHDPKQSLLQGWYLPLESAPSTHIIKLANADYPELLLNEYLCLKAARRCGLEVPNVTLLPTSTPLLCIERFDRVFPENSRLSLSGHFVPKRLHQEDLCQAFGILSQYKYEEVKWGGLEAIAKFLSLHSSSPVKNIAQLLKAILFNYLVGNCDNHLKNLSIRYSEGWHGFTLAPFYDLVGTVYFTNLDRKMAMKIGEHRDIDRINKEDLQLLGKQLHIAPRRIFQEGKNLVDQFEDALLDSTKDISAQERKIAQNIIDLIAKDAQPRLEILRNA